MKIFEAIGLILDKYEENRKMQGVDPVAFTLWQVWMQISHEEHAQSKIIQSSKTSWSDGVKTLAEILIEEAGA